MNDVLINTLFQRVKHGDMKLEQVPVPYQEIVRELLKIEEV